MKWKVFGYKRLYSHLFYSTVSQSTNFEKSGNSESYKKTDNNSPLDSSRNIASVIQTRDIYKSKES